MVTKLTKTNVTNAVYNTFHVTDKSGLKIENSVVVQNTVSALIKAVE